MFKYWPDSFDLSWHLLRPIAAAIYGGGEFNECFRTAERIKPGDNESWHREWYATAEHVHGLAKAAEQAGHITSAHDHFLRACTYYRWAEAFLTETDPRQIPTYDRVVECFTAAGRWFPRPLESVEIPYENGKSLPAYFYPGRGTPERKVPGILYIAGADVLKEELYFMGGRGVTDPGMALLTVDGPGQGATIRHNGIRTRYDFEVPVRAMIDYLVSRPEVDPERIAVIGRSFAGYLSCRALAFEHRPKALVVFGAFYEITKGKIASNPTRWLGLSGTASEEAAWEVLKRFTLKGVVDKIKCPMMIVHGEDDHLVPVEHAHRTYNEATCPKELVIYKRDQPGSVHCAYDSFPETMPLMFDWLADKLQYREAAGR